MIWDGREVGVVWWVVHELGQVVLRELNGDGGAVQEGGVDTRERDVAD